MFVSTFKKAHDVVEGVATDAAFALATVVLACGAILFAAAGVVSWLSTMMPAYYALFIVSLIIAAAAALVFLIGRRDHAPKPDTEKPKTADSPLASLTKSLSSMGAPLDVVASSLFARQLKKSPVATLAATAAVGALLSMMADAALDDD